MKIKPVLKRMLRMCPDAWYIFMRTLQLSCLLLFLCMVTLMEYDATGSRELIGMASALYELPQALLIISAIGSVCIEELQS